MRARSGSPDSRGIRDALNVLKTVDVVVPVWSSASGTGSNALYTVSAFAKVRVMDYALAGDDPGVAATFLGYVSCQ